MKTIIQSAVERYRERILATQDYIWKNPETGYKEVKTSRYLAKTLEEMGYELTYAGDIPGFYTVVDTGREGPEVLVLCELDSLICKEHPDADPETGAVHCCGHSAQCAAMVGIAGALKDPEILAPLSGRIRLAAVPAEELIEIEFRKGLKEQGTIGYFGGKPEFLRRGYFDGVDLAFMLHTSGGTQFAARGGSVGCVSKRIVYKGKAAHAGGSPWSGCNALYAATQGISAINALRETFKESDIIRVHPIITHGGSAVNAIPDTVVLESYIRGSSFEALKQTNVRVNRALAGAALSLGANVDIQDFPGYAPYRNAQGLTKLFTEAVEAQGYEVNVSNRISSGSTDMGDLSCVMPIIHPYAPGAVGTSHGMDYVIAHPDLACVASAEVQVEMLYMLLSDGATRAKEIVEEYEPMFKNKEEYFAYLSSFDRQGDRIVYGDDEVRILL